MEFLSSLLTSTSGGPIIREQDIVKNGFLEKQSKYIKQWKRRWVVLTGGYLCTYEINGDELAGRSPTEFVALRDCLTVRSAEDEVGRNHSFRVDSIERSFFFVASDRDEKEAWIGAIGRMMIRPSVLFRED